MRKKSILIIDDENNLRSSLGMVLQRAGYEVSGAPGAQEALQMLETTPFDLIFLDLRMPGMGGMQLLPELTRLCPNIPVLILTAIVSLETAVQALGLGAYGYLLKPIDPEQIVARVRDVLAEIEQTRRRKELMSEIHSIVSSLRA